MAKHPIVEVNLSLLPHQAADNAYIQDKLKKEPKLRGCKVENFKIIRRSIDARKAPVKVNLGILVSETDEPLAKFIPRKYEKIPEDAKQVIIVGAGPAGLFAGLKAIELGLRPIILERGKKVEDRKQDIADISRKGIIDKDSNYCFGEGGAGTYSDGKLYTRSKKRGNIQEVLEILHQFGASEDILVNSHPHIGSDKLPTVIKNIRNKIIECGGEIRFQCRMDEIVTKNDEVKGVVTSKGETIDGPVILAIGHSARDSVKMLHEKGVNLEAKGIAIGVRLEHPQDLIDKMQYHTPEGRGHYLPAAEYSFVNQADGRGVYSFCMCPGGVIVPAMTENNQIVVNGMSASARSGKWANSGYVVELHPGDIKGFEGFGPLEMMALQESLEKKFADASQDTLKAPAQRINDFLKGRISEDLPPSSYAPGIIPMNLHNLFPSEISERLKSGLQQIGKRAPEFVSNNGVMIGLESRTSSPIRMPRDKDTMEHIGLKNLYPVGEGAGYAGGIVSAAMDGIKSIEAVNRKINSDG